MRHEHLPSGHTWEEALSVYDLASALRVAKERERMLWFRLRDDSGHRYEVYPGGRNIAYPIEMLERRRERQGPLREDHKCRHAWEAAGQFKQCFKCGEIKPEQGKK